MRGSGPPAPRRNPSGKPKPQPLILTESPERPDRPDRTAPRNSLLLVLAFVWLAVLTAGGVVALAVHTCPPSPPPPPVEVKRAVPPRPEEVIFNLTATSPKSFTLPLRELPARPDRYAVCCFASDGVADCGLAAGVSVRVITSAQTLHVLVLAARETQCTVSFGNH